MNRILSIELFSDLNYEGMVINITCDKETIAPAIEYSLTANSGFLFGAWFTIAGQNTEAFAAAAIAYSYIF